MIPAPERSEFVKNVNRNFRAVQHDLEVVELHIKDDQVSEMSAMKSFLEPVTTRQSILNTYTTELPGTDLFMIKNPDPIPEEHVLIHDHMQRLVQ